MFDRQPPAGRKASVSELFEAGVSSVTSPDAAQVLHPPDDEEAHSASAAAFSVTTSHADE